jgi:hypothetical protein
MRKLKILLAIYFYYVTQKNLVKEYSGMKKKKEKRRVRQYIMMMKNYVESLRSKEEYEKIEKVINNYNTLKVEFMESDSLAQKGWWWIICFCSLIIITGLIQGLEKTHFLV